MSILKNCISLDRRFKMSENKNFFRASAEDFKKIPGSPVAGRCGQWVVVSGQERQD